MNSADSKVNYVHRDLYKTRTPPWKESYRQRCLDRLRENRSKLQMRFRKMGESKGSFIKELMREELLDMKHHQNEFKSSKENKSEEDLVDFDIDQVLNMFEDIQDELRQEELKLLEEFEKYEDSLHDEESVLCSAIEKLCTEEVVCPLCEKNPILMNKAVIFCKCGMRINTEQDCLTLSNVKSLLESGVKEHNSICDARPTFTVVSELGIQNLLMSCQDCDWMSVII
ncbi:hypothetical protein ACJMK2_011993 [Sinanodonta woodiana]|uniref:RPA-interacting protein n=1 Tax=Sinanodonta woodiana TaxID=1069815 RepID=A0ABD3V6T3_SINWO